MLYHNRLFLAVGLLSVGVLTCPSVAAPAVKRLGVQSGNNVQSNIQNSKMVASKSSTSAIKTTNAGQRAPSVRLGTTATKPVVKTIGGTKLSAPKTTTSNIVDTERLSVIRKHLIQGGTGATSGIAPQSQGIEADNMLKRIVALEEQMLNKQEILEAGEGITIDDKTIAVSEEIVALPEKVNEIDQKISGLDNKVDIANLSENYYDKGYIQENYYTKQYVDQIVSQLSGANVVSQFDPSFLHQNTGN